MLKRPVSNFDHDRTTAAGTAIRVGASIDVRDAGCMPDGRRNGIVGGHRLRDRDGKPYANHQKPKKIAHATDSPFRRDIKRCVANDKRGPSHPFPDLSAQTGREGRIDFSNGLLDKTLALP